MSTTNYHVTFRRRPGANAEPNVSDFTYDKCPYPEQQLKEGSVLVKTCYLSVDPALRCLMNEDPGVEYLSRWELGQRIDGSQGVGVVVASNHSDYTDGDLVEGAALGWPWTLYFVRDTTNPDEPKIRKLDKAVFGKNPSLALSSLVGLTALIGLWEKGHVQTGTNQTLVVSGASGATGSLAGQMGRCLGCTNVVGICGTNEKCDWLTSDLGFNGAINYKSDDIAERLRSLCPRGIDVYFDNVGGEISDTVIEQMTPDSHVILCGQISQYNKDVPYPPPIPENTEKMLKQKNITRERFLVLNYEDRFEEAFKQMLQWILTGEIKYHETVAEGLDQAPEAFVSMMTGGNKGKQIVHVSDPEL